MRILQINKFHWLKGGAERYYFDLQRELEALTAPETRQALGEAGVEVARYRDLEIPPG